MPKIKTKLTISNQLSLFEDIPLLQEDKEQQSESKLQEVNNEQISDLIYVPNFIGSDEHDFLVEKIDSQQWLTDLQRRVQHYGYKYDYKKHNIDKSFYIAPLPNWALTLAQRLHKVFSPTLPDQVIVNEYQPGQGISSHTDCVSCFTDVIISLSLCSSCVMDFTHNQTGLKTSLLLEPKSLIVLKNEARYNWSHGIAKRKSDSFEGNIIKRSRRISLTFRTVMFSDK
ncbi:alkylated DNA repair protein [Cylindrospermum stagnale PCC 7417]|uniref:Alkylated DNA repair protein n=1 Tax=Cylindrospermum stagnale PCC 7417 TaxID=56107 RepID=K9X2I1_9NOST|nr:alpha-ketoglutarate-dependent dioxygenase AlkB [Cylindrospermum stagnale]AFZ26648.1 alkylated DNA repair protein [Cylindrospermum stagnale PCC 7417]